MDLLQFFSSIAWQIVFILVLFTILIFRKSIGKFSKDFKSFKIGKDGLELQTKIETIENRVKKIETTALLSDSIAVHRHEYNALFTWEKINQQTILLFDRFGLIGLESFEDRVEWLKKQKLCNDQIYQELIEGKSTIDAIDSSASEMKPEELKLFIVRINTLHFNLAKLVDEIIKKLDNLFKSELKQQFDIFERWRQIGEKIMQIIRQRNPIIYELILEQSENVIFQLESELRSILISNEFLNTSQLEFFLKFRDLNRRLSYLDNKAIHEYKHINIEQISTIQREIFYKLSNNQ